jgi:SAM-dependent methyltransferase
VKAIQSAPPIRERSGDRYADRVPPSPPTGPGTAAFAASVSFDRMADRYDETRGGTRRGERVARAIAAHVHGPRVLEVGVGTGLVATALRSNGRSVLGVDLSLPMLRQAERRLGAVVAQADGFSLPVRSGSIDTVVMVWVVHLVPDPRAFLSDSARVLRRGGRIVVVSSRHLADHDELTRVSFGLGERIRPCRGDGPDDLARLAGDRLAVVATGLTPFDSWQTSPNDEADRIERRVWSSLWDVDDERWEREVGPVVRELRAMPDPDRPRQHRSRHEITVLAAR